MKKISTRNKGNEGENLACEYLIKNNFIILSRNYLKKWGEIDIVAQKGGCLHFVEVKSVFGSICAKDTSQHRPEENVHNAKIRHLRRIIESYMWDYHKGHDVPFQVHVVCVYVNRVTGTSRIKMIENIIL